MPPSRVGIGQSSANALIRSGRVAAKGRKSSENADLMYFLVVLHMIRHTVRFAIAVRDFGGVGMHAPTLGIHSSKTQLTFAIDCQSIYSR